MASIPHDVFIDPGDEQHIKISIFPPAGDRAGFAVVKIGDQAGQIINLFFASLGHMVETCKKIANEGVYLAMVKTPAEMTDPQTLEIKGHPKNII